MTDKLRYRAIGDYIILPREDKFSVITPRGLKKITDQQLEEEIRNAYDRWNWDTGSDSDRKALDMLEEELKYRKESGVKVECVKTSSGKSVIKRTHVE